MTHLQPIPAPAEPMLDCHPRQSVMIPIGPAGVPAEFIGFDGLDGLEHVAIRFAGRHAGPVAPDAGAAAFGMPHRRYLCLEAL